jgi:hypothetical protein
LARFPSSAESKSEWTNRSAELGRSEILKVIFQHLKSHHDGQILSALMIESSRMTCKCSRHQIVLGLLTQPLEGVITKAVASVFEIDDRLFYLLAYMHAC